MSLNLTALVIEANDPERVARFWGGLLDRDVQADDDGFTLPDPRSAVGDGGFAIDVFPTDLPKLGPNQAHPDLTSTSIEDQRAIVERVLSLGGQHLDIGQGPEVTHVVMGDPEGNELCVIAPGNRFLADTARIGCLASDGTRAVGEFWSAALGWPLVWDEGEETAVQSPHGGSKMSWGGPPVAPKLGKNRLHLDVAPPPDGDQRAEVDRLIALGARCIDVGQGDVTWQVMADPDGNEFCVLTPR